MERLEVVQLAPVVMALVLELEEASRQVGGSVHDAVQGNAELPGALMDKQQGSEGEGIQHATDKRGRAGANETLGDENKYQLNNVEEARTDFQGRGADEEGSFAVVVYQER